MDAQRAKKVAREGAIAHGVYMLCLAILTWFQFSMGGSVRSTRVKNDIHTFDVLLTTVGYIILAGVPFIIARAFLLRRRLRSTPPRPRGTLPMIWVPGTMLMIWGVFASVPLTVLGETWMWIAPVTLLLAMAVLFPFPKKTITILLDTNTA